MNIEDLKKINLKDLDVNKIMELYAEHSQRFIQAGVVIVALFILFSQVGGYFSQGQVLSQEIAQLKAKNEVIDQMDAKQRRITQINKASPVFLSEEELSALIADLATQTNVTITNLAPGQVVSEKWSESLTASVDLKVGSFRNLLEFLKLIEEHKASLRIDGYLVSNSNQAMYQERGGKGPSPLIVQVKITSVKLKK